MRKITILLVGLFCMSRFSFIFSEREMEGMPDGDVSSMVEEEGEHHHEEAAAQSNIGTIAKHLTMGQHSAMIGSSTYKDASTKGKSLVDPPYQDYKLQYSWAGTRYPGYRLQNSEKVVHLTAGSSSDFVAKFKPNSNPEVWSGFYKTGYDHLSGWIYFKTKDVSTKPLPSHLLEPKKTLGLKLLPPPAGEMFEPKPTPLGLHQHRGGSLEVKLDRIEKSLSEMKGQLKAISSKMFPGVDSSRQYHAEKIIKYQGKTYNKGENLPLDVVSGLIKSKYKYSVSCGGNPMMFGDSCRSPEKYGCGLSSSPPLGIMGGYRVYYLNRKPDDL